MTRLGRVARKETAAERPKPGALVVLRRPDGLVRVVRSGGGRSELPLDRSTMETRVLAAAWEALRRVGRLDGAVLADVHTVLALTCLAQDVDRARARAARRPWPEPAPPSRASAAHPRAFRGTKKQPPKRASAEPVDLRAWLFDASDEAALVARLWPRRREAIEIAARRRRGGAAARGTTGGSGPRGARA